ncbi:phospholipase domain-containing protein [Cupriavidus basilensis]
MNARRSRPAISPSRRRLTARTVRGHVKVARQGRRRPGTGPWRTAASWYDFAVTCDSDPAFYRRFAGTGGDGRAHGERSGHGVSADPLG